MDRLRKKLDKMAVGLKKDDSKSGRDAVVVPAGVYTPSYAETMPRDPYLGVTAAEPHECRQMLREMYALNVTIASLAYVHEAGKPMVRARQRRAAAALTELRNKVDSWLEVERGWSESELKTLLQIKEIIMEMQPVPVPFDAPEPEIISDRVTDTASMTTSTWTSPVTSNRTSARGSLYTGQARS